MPDPKQQGTLLEPTTTGQPPQAVTPQLTESPKPKPKAPKPPSTFRGPGGQLTPQEATEFEGFMGGKSLSPDRVQYFEKKLGLPISPYMGYEGDSKLQYYRGQAESWARTTLDQDLSTLKPTRKILLLQQAKAKAGEGATADEVSSEFAKLFIGSKASMYRDQWGSVDPAKSKEKRIQADIRNRSSFAIQGALEEEQEEPEPIGAVSPNEFDRYISSAQISGDEVEFQALQFGKKQAAKGIPREELKELVREERERLYIEAYEQALKTGELPPSPVSLDYREAATSKLQRDLASEAVDISYDEETGRLVYKAARPGGLQLKGGSDRFERKQPGEYFLKGGLENDFRKVVEVATQASPSLMATRRLVEGRQAGQLPDLPGLTPEEYSVFIQEWAKATPIEKDSMVADPQETLKMIYRQQTAKEISNRRMVEGYKDAQQAMIAGKDVRIDLTAEGITDTPKLQEDLMHWHIVLELEKKYGKGFKYDRGLGEGWLGLPLEEREKLANQGTRMANRDLASAMARGTGMIWMDPDPWGSTKFWAEQPFYLSLPGALITPAAAITLSPAEYADDEPDLNFGTPRAIDFKQVSALDQFNKMFITTGMGGVTKHLREELKGMSDEEYEKFTSTGLFPEEKVGNTFGVGGTTYGSTVLSFFPLAQVSETAVRSIDLALGITDTDPLSRRRRVARMREGTMLAEEYGDMFGDLADSLEVEDPDTRAWFIRAGLLGGFAMEFTPLGASWIEAPAMGIVKAGQLTKAAVNSRNAATKLMPKLASQIRQGKITHTEAFNTLKSQHPYHAKMAEMRATTSAGLRTSYMRSQDQLVFLAEKKWKEAEKIAEEAGIIQKTSPAVLPGQGYASQIDRDVWIADRARELQGIGKKPSEARKMAMEEFLEDSAKLTDEANAHTQPFNLYKRYEATEDGILTERFYLRWGDEQGNAQWYRWFERDQDGALKFAGGASLNGKALRKNGFGLYARQGQEYYFNVEKVGSSVDAPLGAVRANEVLALQGEAGQFLAQNRAIQWHGTAPTDPKVLDTGILPAPKDIWFDVYEPGARVGFVEVPVRPIKELKPLKRKIPERVVDGRYISEKEQLIRRYKTKGKPTGRPFEQAVVDTPVAREVPEPISVRPAPPKTVGEQVELANKYHTARAEALKAQLESAQLRAEQARQAADDFDSLDTPLRKEFDEQKRLEKQLSLEIKRIEQALSSMIPDVEKVTGELAASALRVQKTTEKLKKVSEYAQKVRNLKVSKAKAKEKRELLEKLTKQEDQFQSELTTYLKRSEELENQANNLYSKYNRYLGGLAEKVAQKNIIIDSLYGANNTLRAYREGFQSDPRLRRLISRARKEKDPKKLKAIQDEYAKIRMELQAQGAKGQPTQPGLINHMPEWYQASSAQMSRALRGAAREAETQLKAVERAYKEAKQKAKKTGPGWDERLIREATRKKRSAEIMEARSRAFEKALDSLTNDLRVGEAALEDLPGISRKFVDVLEGSTLKKPPAQRSFLRRLLRRTVDGKDGNYTIDPKRLLEELEQSWGKRTIDHVTEKISPVEGAKGTRGGLASDILLRIKEAVSEGEEIFKLSLDEVSELQDINIAMRRSWIDSHKKGREIGVTLALKRARDDISGTFKDYDSTENMLSKMVREQFAAFNPIRAELGEVSESIEATLRAVRNYNDHVSAELYHLSQTAEQEWKKIKKARRAGKADDTEAFAFTEQSEFLAETIYRYIDGNTPMEMDIRAPVLPAGKVHWLAKEFFRPALGRTTWFNLGDVSIWSQMRRHVVNDPNVLSEYTKVKEYTTFLDRAATKLEELESIARQYGDWKKVLSKEKDESFRVILTEAMEEWIQKGRPQSGAFNDTKLLMKKYGENPWESLSRDRANGVVWALSRSLLPTGETFSRHVDSLMYTKTIEILKGSQGSSMKSFHQELSGIYTGSSLTNFEKQRYRFNGFDASDVADTRSTGIIALAAAHGAIADRANRLVTKSVGGFMTPNEVVAAGKILNAGEWTKLDPKDVDAGIRALNKTGRPFTQAYVRTSSKANADVVKFSDYIQTGADFAGRNYYMTKTLVDAIDATMPSIIKELSEQAHRVRSPDKTKLMRDTTAVKLASLWRASIVTGLFVPRPGYLANNFYGDFSQIWRAEGFGQATHTSLEFIMGIPWWSKRLIEGRAWMAKKLGVEMDSVLPDLTTSLFNPHINDIFMGKAGHFRTKSGRVKNNRQHLQEAIELGIFDTYVHEETLRHFTTAAKKNRRAGKVNEILAGVGENTWTRDISEMASFVQQRQRFALYTNLVAKGYTKEEAARRTLNALYDWKNSISQIEAQNMTKWVPFWRFWRLALKQTFLSLTEPIVRPSKEMLKKAVSAQTGSARIHQQQVFVNNLHPFIDPAITEDYADDQKKWEAAVPYMVPHWKGAGRAVWDISRQSPEQSQFYDSKRGLESPITHTFSTTGPFTELETTSMMATWMSSIAGAIITGPYDFHGKHGLNVALADDWQENTFEHTIDHMSPHVKSLLRSGVSKIGLDVGGSQYNMVRPTGAELWWAENGNGLASSLSESDLTYDKDGKPLIPAHKAIPTRMAPALLEFHGLFNRAIFENKELQNSEGGIEFLKGARFFARKHLNVDQQYPFSAPIGGGDAAKFRARTIKKGLEELEAPMQQAKKNVGRRIKTPQELYRQEEDLQEKLKLLEERYGPSEIPFMRPREEETEE